VGLIFLTSSVTTLESGASLSLRDTQGHDDPADRAQESFDRRERASIVLAPFNLTGSGMLPSLHDAPIEQDSNGPVSGERSLEMLVETLPIARDDDQLPDPLLGKTRERWRRRDSTGRAPLGGDRHVRNGPLGWDALSRLTSS